MSNSINISGDLADPTGSQALGNFSILSNATVVSKIPIVGTSTVAVPATAQTGVAVVVISAVSTAKLHTVSGDTGITINPNAGLAALLVWDQGNLPADVYVTCSASSDEFELIFF